MTAWVRAVVAGFVSAARAAGGNRSGTAAASRTTLRIACTSKKRWTDESQGLRRLFVADSRLAVRRAGQVEGEGALRGGARIRDLHVVVVRLDLGVFEGHV